MPASPRLALALVPAVLVLATAVRAQDVDPPVADLVAQLEDERWEVREAATRRLAALLPEGLPLLLAALEAGGAETQARIRAVLGPIRIDARGRVRQWAISATASSEYSSEGWSALRATGEPDTPEAGDHPTAWASRDADGGLETLDLVFRYPVRPAQLRVHESFNPGAVVRIEARLPGGRTAVLWEGEDSAAAPAGVLDAALEPPADPVREVRVVLDTRIVPGWNEIDAVELVGEPLARAPAADLPRRRELVEAAIDRKRAEIERLRETIRRLEEEIRDLEEGR